MSDKINLNTADRAELERVDGVGPKRAEAILKLRAERGRFKSIEELDDLPDARGSLTRETYKNFTG